MGIDKLLVVVEDLAKSLNIFSKVIHGGSLLSLIALWGVVKDLKDMDWAALLQELKDVDAAERKQLEDKFAATLDLQDQVVQAKILASVTVLEDAVDVVQSIVKVVVKVKAILGL